MGMSTHVVGFIPPDETWQKMKAVWDACTKAGVDIPGDVLDFFDEQQPDPEGRETEIPVREWTDRDAAGYEVVIAEIPPEVKVIRFYNSW